MAAPAQVTICIPVYNGAQFVAQLLNSVARQTYRDVQVLISDDASTDGSADVCRGFAQEHGFELIVQPERRGWVENCNWLLERARGDFVCLVPHDDVLDERYVEVLAAYLSATPVCVQAFSDMRGIGVTDALFTQSSLVGPPFERIYGLVTRHFDGTPFRGLVRREALDRAGGLPANACEGFAADVDWIARLAREGEIHRVPEVLYFKRFYARSTAHAWGRWAEDAKTEAWLDHCGHLLGVALGLELSAAQLWLITHAAIRRLIMANEQRAPYPAIRHLPTGRKMEMAEALLARFDRHFFAPGTSGEERRRVAAMMVEGLSAENVAAMVRSLEAVALLPRTPANLLRFLRGKPLKPR